MTGGMRGERTGGREGGKAGRGECGKQGGTIPLTCMPLMEQTDVSCFSSSLMFQQVRDFCRKRTALRSFSGLQFVLGWEMKSAGRWWQQRGVFGGAHHGDGGVYQYSVYQVR